MSRTSGIRGGLYAVSEWIAKFSLNNLQWAVFNLPIALLVISMIYAEKTEDIYYLAPTLIVLMPILFFPATTALFAKAREWVRKDHDDRPDRTYISYYKENYKVSLQAGIVFTILWGVLLGDIYYFSTVNELIMNVFFIVGIILYVFTINFFSVTVHFDLKARPAFKKAFLVTIVSPLSFVTVAITSAIMLYISVYVFPLMIPIFTGSIIAFLSFSSFYRLFLKLNHKEKNG
ncbi:MAG: DUF624 domain-containing protein [Halobacillus sp.]|uniref:YesL family protein n=2 Tax=Halobacillus sp. TaxID=56800 RepID=UPI003BB16E2B